MHLVSIQVGTPKTVSSDFTTAIFKQPVNGPIYLSKDNLTGDKQADLSVHGGPDKAINVYPVEHYDYWRQRTGILFKKRIHLPTPANGAFGENFTVSGLLEDNIFIGDIFKIGEVIVQVTQPRQPCWKLARKFNQPKLPFWVHDTNRTGWYFRVLETGSVESNTAIELVESGCKEWSVAKANQLIIKKNKPIKDMLSILECPALSESWQKTFRSSLE